MIDKIFHISDIHIRLYRRGKQYTDVLQQLVNSINARKTPNSLIVLSGDIFHAKTEMSPESVSMATLFLSRLSDTLPVILIAGNHDANLANLSRLDSITPIVQLMDNELIFYYRETGWYKYDNINFYVNSVFQEKLPLQYPTDGTNICIYHGTVDSSIAQGGRFLNGKFKIQDFKQFDFVLLGDIHKTQILSQSPLMAYAGSLMQLNYGEDITEHGYLIWDLKNSRIQHVAVPNNYAYYNLIAQDGVLQEFIEITARNPRIKLKYINCSSSELKQIQRQIKSRYNPDEIMLSKMQDQLLLKSSTFKFNLDNIQNPEYQQIIIREYIQHAQLNIPESQLLEILRINVLYNQIQRNKRALSQNNIWSLVKFTFSNFFSYGSSNVIDFTRYRGVVGILGENRAGKSSLLDAILFMLYDRTSKTNKAISILNNQKDQLYGKLQLLINQKTYIIQKSGVRNAKGDNIAIKCKFYQTNENNELIDLSGTQRSQTVKIIQQYIGTFQDLNTTSFSTQGNSNIFIELPSTNRKTLLNSLLNLTIFDKCYNEANEKTKQLKGALSAIDIVQIQTNLQKSGKEVDRLTQTIVVGNSQLARLKTELDQYEFRLKELILTRKPEQQILIEIEDVSSKIASLSPRIKSIQQLIQSTQSEYDATSADTDQLARIMQSVGIQKKRSRFMELEPHHQKYLSNKAELANKILLQKQQNKKVALLSEVQYDNQCPFCMNNPLTKDALQSKQRITQITNTITQLMNQCDTYQNLMGTQMNSLKTEIEMYERQMIPLYNTLVSEKVQIREELAQLITRLQHLKQQLNQQQILSEKFYSNQLAISQNLLLVQKILDQQSAISSIKKSLTQLEGTLIASKISLATNQQTIKQNKTTKKKYEQINNQFGLLDRYKTLIGRSGIQYYITTNIIIVLQQQINMVLQMISNFNIEFVLEGKSIDINIIYPNKVYQIQTCSGFQKFIISLAIRYALSTMTNKSKAKLFVIDEGFGVMDSQNLTQLNNILTFFSQKYQSLFVISHLEVMKSMFQNIIQVQYKEGISKIA